ncbi:MAG: alpha/beta hydrolase-fold protein, partial [Clostridia bacterium]|nr:alpha/beta hydrolase-fold protein [Clostridia bacterium]
MLHRITSALIVLAMLLTGVAAVSAEEIPVYNPEVTYGNPDLPYGPMVDGLIRVPITMEDPAVSGELVCYSPSDSYPCVDTLVVLTPDGISASQMAEISQWNQVADAEEICVIYIAAPGGTWNLDEPSTDTAFIEYALRVYVGGKLFVDWNERALYVVGYAQGGTMAHELAMAYPARFSGVVSIGGSAVTDEYMDIIGNTPCYPYVETGIYTGGSERWLNNSIPVPVWIIGCGDDDANPSVADYWKSANDVVDEELTNSYGAVFQANKVTTAQLNNEQPISEVWISEIEGALEYDAELNGNIWNKFLSRVRRFVGDPGGSLRAAFEPEDVGMVKYSMEVDGLERQFYVYAPSGYDATEQLPLVICIHGYSSTARAFTTDTEWWRVAQSRNLICAFVQAYPHTGNNVPRWTGKNTEYDTNFIRALVDFMGENYPVDATRRYVTGASNGGQMTCAIGDVMPELFAGISPVGGMDVAGFGSGSYDSVNDSVMLPVYGLAGDHDYFGEGFEDHEAHMVQINKWADMNSIDLDEAL